jgi:dolichol-phosphate mannosyltransferase
MNAKPLLVVIPAYRELENLRELLPVLDRIVPESHVLVVNDESGDGTGAWLRAQPSHGTRWHVLERPEKSGLGRAYLAGFEWALARGYEWIVQMDADFSHKPEDVPRLLAEARKEGGLVLGSRYLDGVRVLNWPLRRLLLSVGAGQYVRWMTGMPFTDPTGGFKCFARETLAAIPLAQVGSNGYAFQIEMTHWAWRLGFPVREVPIVFEDRHAGTSKMSRAIAREAVWKVLQLSLRRRRK